MKGKEKILSLKAKSAFTMDKRDAKSAITGLKAKNAGIDMPHSRGKKPSLKAKRFGDKD